MATWPREAGQRSGEYAGSYVAVWDEHEPGGPTQVTRVRDTEDRLIVEHRPARGDWFTQDVWLTGAFAVVEDLDERARLVRLTVYDLAEGTTVPLEHQPTQPELDVAHGRVTYTTGTSAIGMCQRVLELESRVDRPVGCAPEGGVIADAVAGRDRVGFSTLRDPASGRRCKQLRIAGLDGDGAAAVPLHRDCLGWSLALSDGGFAWDEMDPRREDLATARAYALAGGIPVELGEAVTDTLVGCGDGFYWLVEDGRGVRIDAWHPESGVTTVRRPVPAVLPNSLECSDGRWLQARFDDLSGADERLSFEVLDTGEVR
ncbi:hypothetical protein [Nocardioides insulae]|uniref:hypothetical protein n=1 Tax=Nocardioides insulae TaxID=394734 RepID=UPI00041615EA|nr:hypothetical protein [Nocardioides insulae]